MSITNQIWLASPGGETLSGRIRLLRSWNGETQVKIAKKQQEIKIKIRPAHIFRLPDLDVLEHFHKG